MSSAKEVLEQFLDFDGVLPQGGQLIIPRLGVASHVRLNRVFSGLHSPVLVTALNAQQALEVPDVQLASILDGHFAEHRVDDQVFSVVLCTKTSRHRRLQGLLAKTTFGAHLKIISESTLPRSAPVGQLAKLRKIIRDRTRIDLLNPFNVSFTPPEMFFGRRKIKRFIETYNSHIYLYGPRRIGKTSLVERIRDDLGTLNLTPSIRCRRSAYVDVAALGEDEEELYTEVLRSMDLGPGEVRKLHRQLRKYRARSAVTEAPSARAALDTVIKASGGRAVIILDEVDRWFARMDSAKNPWRALDHIRALTDHRQARVILVGYEHLQASLYRNDFPFTGRGKGLFLGPTDQANVEELVTTPLAELGIELKPRGGILDRIWSATNGRPNLVQEICSDCIQRLGASSIIDAPMVNQVIKSNDALKKMRNTIEHLRWPLPKLLAVSSLQLKQAFNLGDLLEALPKGFEPRMDDVDLSLRQLLLRFVFEYSDEFKTYSWANSDARVACSKWVQTTRRSNIVRQCVADYGKDEWRLNLWGKNGDER